MPLLAFGQVTTLKIEADKSDDSYLSAARVDTNLNIGIFEIHYTKGRLSNSYYYVLDLSDKKVISSFITKNWSYLYNSWIDSDSILHLARGRLFTRWVLFDLNSGDKIANKSTPSEKEKTLETSNDSYVDSQDLYCTSNIVYFRDLRIYYDEANNGFLIDGE